MSDVIAKPTLLARLRGWFLTGLLVTAPILLTIYITWLFVDVIDGWVTELLPPYFSTTIYSNIPGIGLVIGGVSITIIGALAAGFIGRWLIGFGESLLNRMPFVGTIYGASKQILETVMASQSDAFREVVLVEYPRKDLWVIGFVTGTTKGEVQDAIIEDTVNVFVPTTPNPTSGFLLFCPRGDLRYLDMSVEDAVKLVVSGGIVTPPYKQSDKTATGKIAAKKAPAKKLAKKATK
ncbi:MAG: DUF502 domain-containing protein [Candidatus Puniceispirillaceae bacterium]